MPMSTKQTRYGIIKAPPPFCTACTGKRRKLPNPTAFPAIARINPTLEPQDSVFVEGEVLVVVVELMQLFCFLYKIEI
jgi:hypothetical protein